MKCSVCMTGELKPGTTTLPLTRNSSVVVLLNVPALVCDNCGEPVFEEEVNAKILSLAEEVFKSGAQVAIREYPSLVSEQVTNQMRQAAEAMAKLAKVAQAMAENLPDFAIVEQAARSMEDFLETIKLVKLPEVKGAIDKARRQIEEAEEEAKKKQNQLRAG